MGHCVASGGNLLQVIMWRGVAICYWLLCGELWYILGVIVWGEVVICYALLCG
jgi:hypothetical protein